MSGPASSASDGRLRSRPSAPVLPPPSGAGPQALDAVGLPDHLLLVPAPSASPRPLLVWFHGAGGHAASSLPVVRDAASAHGAAVLLPTSAGTSWDLLRGGLGADADALDRALAHVFGVLEVDRVAFGGFSDGASYALSLGLANGDLVEAVLAFSPGFVVPPRRVGLPRCWVAHGRADTVLPVDRCGRRVVEQLRRSQHEVVYEEFDGGHVVRPDLLLQAFGWWLAQAAP